MQDANKNDTMFVAVSRDGRVYVGSTNVQKDKIRNYLVRLILGVGKTLNSFFIHVFDAVVKVPGSIIQKR
jgi:hypothetical protein